MQVNGLTAAWVDKREFFGVKCLPVAVCQRMSEWRTCLYMKPSKPLLIFRIYRIAKNCIIYGWRRRHACFLGGKNFAAFDNGCVLVCHYSPLPFWFAHSDGDQSVHQQRQRLAEGLTRQALRIDAINYEI